MRAYLQRNFNKQVAKMDEEERRARFRWLEHQVEIWKKQAADDYLPIELFDIQLSSLEAILHCPRDMIPVEHWRPDDITEAQGKDGWQRYS